MTKSKIKRIVASERASAALPRSALNTVIEQFVQDSRHKTLLVKGNWGVGKTHAVRAFLLREDGPAPTVSYVSLSGVSRIADERLLVVSGLERESGQSTLENYSVKFAEVAKSVTKMIPSGAGGIADVGIDALQGFLANRIVKDAVVVLDDIERRDALLSLGAVFGAISRLTEVRGAKTIVIMNEDELRKVAPDDAKLLSHQREKIFDREFEYRPSPDEQLKLLELKEAAQYLAPVATKLKLTNLRVLQKTAWAVEEFATHIRGVDAVIKNRVLEQVAIIAAMRFRARQPLLSELLVSSLHFGLTDALLRRQRPGNDKTRLETENPFRGDLEALDYNPLPIDSVVLDFLNTGDLDTKGFEASLPDLKALEVGREFRERIEAISASIWGKFGSFTADEIARLQSFLDGDELARVGGADLGFYLDILEMHGLQPNRSTYEIRWAQSVPVAHGMLSEFHLDRLQADEAKNTVRARVNAALDPQEPQTFTAALEQHRLSASFLQSPEATDRAAIERVLRETSRRGLITDLTILLQQATQPGQLLPEVFELAPPFAAALSDVLDSLSAESEINKVRVDAIRRARSRWNR